MCVENECANIHIHVKRPHPPVTATSEVLSISSQHQLLAGPER